MRELFAWLVRTACLSETVMRIHPRASPVSLAFAATALALLGMTLLWHVPMMLWDHLDLVPLLQASRHETLGDSIFWSIHGGHMHSTAYAVLLVTTELSGGQTWLDCVVSWALLVGYALLVVNLATRSFGDGPRPTRWLLCVVFLALYPGHLANLQWGWQVAVFLCLLGAAITVACLGAARLNGWRNALALVATVFAYLSFATGIALIPAALVLLALRCDLSWPRRAALMTPWLLLGGLLVYSEFAQVRAASAYSLPQLLHYSLNYLGAGVTRFADDLAPWLAVIAIASGIWAFMAVRRERTSLYWLGFALFAGFSAVLTALGRAAPFGIDHAFVTRYVSFSSVFWLGWLGLMVAALRVDPPLQAKWRTRLLVLVMAFAAVNALHMIKQAATLGEESRVTAARIRDSFPQVDEAVLREIYFDQPEVARKRLQQLHRWSFAPFEREPGADD